MAQKESYVFKYEKLQSSNPDLKSKNLELENCYALVSVTKGEKKQYRKANKEVLFLDPSIDNPPSITSWFNQDSYRNVLFYHFFELYETTDPEKVKTYRWIQYYIQKLYWIQFIRNPEEIKLVDSKKDSKKIPVTFVFSPRPDFQKLSWHELSWIMYQMEVIIVKKLKLTLTVKEPSGIEDFYKVIRFTPKITEGTDLCNFQSKGLSIDYNKAMKECLKKIPEFLSESDQIDEQTDPKIKELMYLRYWYTYLPDKSGNQRVLGESIFHKMEENIEPHEEAKFKRIKKKFTHKKIKHRLTKKDIREMMEWTSRYLNNLTGNDKKNPVDLIGDKTTTDNSNTTKDIITPFVFKKWEDYKEKKKDNCPTFPQFLDFLGISGVLEERDVTIGKGAYHIYTGLRLTDSKNFINFMFQHYGKGKGEIDTEKRWIEYANITKYLDQIIENEH